jgi:hypothetical protein
MTCSFRLGRAQIFQLNGRSNWPILWALGMLTLEMPNDTFSRRPLVCKACIFG